MSQPQKFDPLKTQVRDGYVYLEVQIEDAAGAMEVGKFYERVFDPEGPKPQPFVFKCTAIEPSLQEGKVTYKGAGRFDKAVYEAVATMQEVKGQS